MIIHCQFSSGREKPIQVSLSC
uniref:Uncharacterized protein n=1 Tax=Arundo donax TaxID=35708 RepID=A0A0A9AYU5_ARUDO